MSSMCPLGTLYHLIFSLESGYKVCGTFQCDYHAIDDQISYVTMLFRCIARCIGNRSKHVKIAVYKPYIQPSRSVPRACRAIQLYTAIQHARIQLHYTAYSLYTIQPYTPILWILVFAVQS